jgi:hypothetical protein
MTLPELVPSLLPLRGSDEFDDDRGVGRRCSVPFTAPASFAFIFLVICVAMVVDEDLRQRGREVR